MIVMVWWLIPLGAALFVAGLLFSGITAAVSPRNLTRVLHGKNVALFGALLLSPVPAMAVGFNIAPEQVNILVWMLGGYIFAALLLCFFNALAIIKTARQNQF